MSAANGYKFRGAIMGYNKTEVDDYVARTESELEIQESRKSKWEQQISELNLEIERLKNIIESERDEKEELLNKNSRFEKMLEDMEHKLLDAEKEYDKLQQEFQDLQDHINRSGINPKTIQDAILNAQRMGEIVIEEARRNPKTGRE